MGMRLCECVCYSLSQRDPNQVCVLLSGGLVHATGDRLQAQETKKKYMQTYKHIVARGWDHLAWERLHSVVNRVPFKEVTICLPGY